jgi:putative MFS transporter
MDSILNLIGDDEHRENGQMAPALSGIDVEENCEVLLAGPQGSGWLNDLMEVIGNGRYQLFLTLTLGLCNMAVSITTTAFAFINAEMHEVPDSLKGYLGAAIFVGMLVGSIVWGVISDRWGRQPTMIVVMTIITVFMLGIAASPSWIFTMIFEALCGFGNAGVTATVFPYLTEFLAKERRGFYLVLAAWFWMVGTVVSTGMAWLLLGVFLVSWRFYALFCGLAVLLVALLVLRLDESPRYAFVQRNFKYPAQLLARVAADNRRGAAYREFIWSACQRAACWPDPVELSAHWTLRKLFASSIRRQTLLMSAITFVLSYAWYGLMLFLPLILDHLDLRLDIYESTFIIVAGNLPGNIASSLLVDRVGRKKMLCATLFLSSAAAVAFSFSNLVDSTAYVIVFGLLFSAVGTMAWNALSCTTPELFPTELRNSGMGFALACGRIGSIVAMIVGGILLGVSLSALLAILALLLLTGGILALLLPETGQQLLRDFLSESQLGFHEATAHALPTGSIQTAAARHS